ncbi:MAG: GMC family oxidoreductase [Cytophagaceae bacterium]|nr:GMC family oxidoreductase [Cytophagaceae bacterium]
MNLNLKAAAQNTYDAIVIGTGISGGWAMKELTQKGLKVLALERGRMVEHVTDYPTTMLKPWEIAHRGEMPPEDKTANPVVNKCYAYNENTQHFFVKDQEHPYIQDKPFDWIRGYQVGGKSLLWARWTQRWGEHDFEANAREGIGTDWPIRYKELAPWYSYVEKFAGISGNRDGLPQVPDGEFLPPMAMNCLEKHVKSQLDAKYQGRHLIISRTANLSEAGPQQQAVGRGSCQYRNLCARGCPFGAAFSTNAATLPAARATGRLTLRPDSVVHSIIYNEQKKRATGVRVVDAKTKEMTEYFAKIIFVNASTVNTNLVLQNSTSSRFPNGIGNDSGVLGRYVMAHNYRVSGSGSYEGFEDQYYFGRRPTGIYIPRYRNFGTDKQTAFLRGYSHSGGAGRASWGRGNGMPGFGAELKNSLIKPGIWSFSINAMGEMLPYEDNRIWLDDTQKDQWGMPLVHIDVAWKENEDAMSRDAVVQIQEMLEAVGLKNVSARDNHQNPGLDIHEMGGCRMGRDPKTSMLNGFNQMHAVKNVFVTDGASMASTACQNPSITYMALTARAADYAVKELKKGNL